MPLEIRPVRPRSASDLRRFVDIPWRLHDPTAHPQWVPPLRMVVKDALDSRRNPFYRRAERELFIAYRDGAPVGRIAAIENRSHNAFHHDRVGFWGFFECRDDPEAASALFDSAAEWLRGRGLDTLRGPISPSTNHEVGLLIDGFQWHPTLMTTWNPPYYQRLVELTGFSKSKDMFAYRMDRTATPPFVLPERFAAHARRAVTDGNVRFRDVDLRHFDREIDIAWRIYNEAWEPNWGFVPMTREEFLYMAKELKLLIDPRFAFVAEVDGEPAGIAITLPDFNLAFKAIRTGRLLPTGIFRLLTARRSIRSLRVMMLGVRAGHRSRSIFALFAHELYRRGVEADIMSGEASWILEDNHAMIRPMEAMGAERYRTWRVYDRAIQPAPRLAAS